MFATLTLSPAIDCTLRVEGALMPGDVHLVGSEIRTPGGKGINVAKMLAQNKCIVTAGGILGRCEIDLYRSFLDGAGIGHHFLNVDHPTRENIMVVDQAGAEMKFNRPGFPELAFDWEVLRNYSVNLVEDAEVVIICGSLPVRFPDDTYARLVKLFHETGKTVVLDASGPCLDPAVRERPEIIAPNRLEMAEIVGHTVEDEEAALSEMRRLAQNHLAVIMSDGAKGAYFASGTEVFHTPAPAVRAVDTTGAGDALLGQFCADFFGTAQRCLSKEVMARAVAAGATATEQHGTPAPDISRIEELARSVQEMSS
ncbi:MAG: hexose kinase [Kiritimatiellia bacterium]|jgi:tagatose 6-phosphate kinase|nr:hexose kinase [Kiritimatiellia bacterium]